MSAVDAIVIVVQIDSANSRSDEKEASEVTPGVTMSFQLLMSKSPSLGPWL
jgi:hypothetical protein